MLLSNSTWIIALRGFKDLPFEPKDIIRIYQTDEDKSPKLRADWYYWDEWDVKNRR